MNLPEPPTMSVPKERNLPGRLEISQLSKIKDEVLDVYMNWKRAKDYHQPNSDLGVESWRNYWGKFAERGWGQWPVEALNRMVQQGRNPITYNFIKPTIDSIAGSIMQVPFDPDFLPVGDEITSLTKAIKIAMYSDKELMNWKATYLQLLIHGLVHTGVIKMVVSSEFSKLGNIGFEICLPNAIQFDPYWKDLTTKTCRKCWKESWYTAKEAIAVWPEFKDRLIFEALRVKRSGEQYGAYTGISPYLTAEDDWGSKHRFVEEYEVVTQKKKTEYLMLPNGDQIAIPKMSNTDKPEWLNTYYPEWDKTMVYEEEEKEDVCVIRTSCPDLITDELLENDLIEVQTGRLPFFSWSADRMNGENYSMVDALKDAQMNLNFGEAMVQFKMQSEGGGGAQYTDPEMFQTGEYERFVKHRNRPNENFKLKPGYLDKGIIPSRPVVKAPFPQEIYQNLQHIMDKVWPFISRRPPSSFARPEPGNDTSGRLFDMLRVQSDTLIYTMHFGLRQFWNDVFEAYLLQAINTYGNEMIPRDFGFGGEKTTLNEPVVLPNGMMGIHNDVRELRRIRHKIIISETQESPTEKMNNVAVLSEFMSRLPPELVGTRSVVASEMSKNINQFSVESKRKIEEVSQSEYELAKETILLQLANVKMQRMQLEMAMQAPQQPMLPGPQGGVSQPGQGAAQAQKAGGQPHAGPLNQPSAERPGGVI